MNSIPTLGGNSHRLEAIAGTVPSPGAWPKGCRFYPRCPSASAHPECKENPPELVEIEPQRWVRCSYAKTSEPAVTA